MVYTRYLFFLLLVICISCSPVSRKVFSASQEKLKHHIGFVLYDPEKKEYIQQYNADRYFTPGSNTKIFTFYTSLKILGDSIPAFQYSISHDSLLIWGTGDPSFLYKNVHYSDRAYSFLKNEPRQIYFSNSNFDTPPLGRGWAWDDYNDYYSAERSAFPVYGNTISTDGRVGALNVYPEFFKKNILPADSADKTELIRKPASNQFDLHPGRKNNTIKKDIPFKTSPELVADLLSDTLNRSVMLTNRSLQPGRKILYSLPADSLYRELMQNSDNFIGEQLLLLCSGMLSDTLKPEVAIRYAKKNLLNDLSDEPVWIDGSGLSRYNLFTPRSIVEVWEKIYHTVARDRLLKLLAAGGESGTLRRWYKSDKPYIFGKTGTLSNNHCLSGYLLTKKGKTLIFSFMNNNFTVPVEDVRKNMEEIVRAVYLRY